MAELVEPLCESDGQGNQWLSGSQGINLLLSRNGRL